MHEGDNVLTHNEEHTQRTYLTKHLPTGDEWNIKWIYIVYIFLQPLTGLAARALVRYYYGVLEFYNIWSTRHSTWPDLTVRNCPLSDMGIKVSIVCSDSTVFLSIVSITWFSRYGVVINSMNPVDAYVHHWNRSPLTQVMAWYLLGAKPLPEPILIYNQLHP